MARREMRWFGWGDPAHVSHGLPRRGARAAAGAGGAGGRAAAAVPGGSAIGCPAAVEFDIPGVELRTDHEARLLRAAGKSYPGPRADARGGAGDRA